MSKKKDQEDSNDDVESQTEAPPPEPTFMQRLHVERALLADRLDRLSASMSTPEFSEIDQEERERLHGQKLAMGHYLEILKARIAYHERRGEK